MLSVTDLISRPVITRDGRILGRVHSLRVSPKWDVPLVTVALNRDVADELDVRKPLFGTPKVFLDPEGVAALGDNLILERPLEEIPDTFVAAGMGEEAQKVLGRKVYGEDAYYFGEVTNLLLDSGKWRIHDLLVDVHRKAADAMGFPMTLFGTCTAKVPIQAVETADPIQVPVGPDEFKKYVVKERAQA